MGSDAIPPGINDAGDECSSWEEAFQWPEQPATLGYCLCPRGLIRDINMPGCGACVGGPVGLNTSNPATSILWRYFEKWPYQLLSSTSGVLITGQDLARHRMAGKVVYHSQSMSQDDTEYGTVIWEFPDQVNAVTWSKNYSGPGYIVQVHTVSPGLDFTWAREFLSTLQPVPEADADQINVNFWSNTAHGPNAQSRKLKATDPEDFELNYSATTKKALQGLLSRTKYDISGRIILLHGEPGLGKTYFIRLLLREWKKWCTGEYLMDAEQFFGSAAYMTSVVFNESRDGNYRLIICEDADEFISADGKSAVGQSVSRLFNLADGMVGQGTNTLILLTTNEPIEKFHPALLRPGRSLANIEFEKLSAAESNAWLNHHGLDDAVDESQTLAELYERLGKGRVVSKAKGKARLGFGAR